MINKKTIAEAHNSLDFVYASDYTRVLYNGIASLFD